MSSTTRIIAVTGTKGKTSVARAVHYVVGRMQKQPALLVDTHQVLLGNASIATYGDSKKTSGLVPTVCPGRFLIALKDIAEPVAVLEASVGSSRKSGLGYRSHEIGIFTNVFDDHIGMADYLRNRRDLAKAKSFIFRYIKTSGYAVYNADEPLIRKQLRTIDGQKNIKMIACTMRPNKWIVRHAHIVVTRAGDAIEVQRSGVVIARVLLNLVPIFLGGRHLPSLYNALSIVAALWAYCKQDGDLFAAAISYLSEYTPDSDGSRLVEVETQTGTRVIIDFAHESESLKHIALYAKSVIKPGGQVIGIVRLSGERSDAHIKATVKYFSPYYDRLVIYDKDAHNVDLLHRQNRKPGDVPRLIYEAAVLSEGMVHIAKDEESALAYAKRVATDKDVVVYIVGGSSGGLKRVQSIFNTKGVNS